MKLLSICSFILIAFCGYSQPKTIDKIVAQVGDKVILLSDIQGQKLQALQAGVTLEPALDSKLGVGLELRLEEELVRLLWMVQTFALHRRLRRGLGLP